MGRHQVREDRHTKMSLKKDLEVVLHLNGCQQRTAGYNEGVDGKELDTDDMERLEEITLKEVLEVIQKHRKLNL